MGLHIEERGDGTCRVVNHAGKVVAEIGTDLGIETYSLLMTPSAEGAGAADAIDMSIQLVDKLGNTIAKRVALKCFIGVDTAGVYTAGTAITSSSIITGEGRVVSSGSAAIDFVTDATGLAVIRLGFSSTGTRRLVAFTPDGKAHQSSLLTWA